MQFHNLLTLANHDPSEDFVDHCSHTSDQVSACEHILANSDWVNGTTIEIKHLMNLLGLCALPGSVASLFKRCWLINSSTVEIQTECDKFQDLVQNLDLNSSVESQKKPLTTEASQPVFTVSSVPKQTNENVRWRIKYKINAVKTTEMITGA